MLNLVILVLVIGIFVFFLEVLKNKHSVKDKGWDYKYKRRNFLMSRAEHQCYDALMTAVGKDYYIFPQVHLPTIVDSNVVGQNWKGAFRHISQKSVDYVLCDKAYISPKLVIELDDRSHERADRIERDKEVERILKDAGLPLLRLGNNGSFNIEELCIKINTSLGRIENAIPLDSVTPED